MSDCQNEIKQMKYELAIIHELTNLSIANSKEILHEALKDISNRTEKYADLRLTAGPLYVEGQEVNEKGDKLDTKN